MINLKNKNFLRFKQRMFFLLYRTGVLKYISKYDYHYFVKHLIDEGDIIINIGTDLDYYSSLFAKWTGDSGKVFDVGTQMEKPSALFENQEKIDYIKCNIDGFEYIILSNMKEIIRKYKPKVQVKVSPENREKLLELFDELGYTPYKLYKYRLIPQSEDYQPLPGDYIFIPE